MSCSSAAAPPFPVITGRSTRSLSFTLTTLRNPLKARYSLGAFQLNYSLDRSSAFSQYLFLSTFSAALLILRLTSGVILPEFSHRWRRLIAFSSQAEAELVDAPDCLFDAAVAYEDRRFFSHCVVDAVGVARAVLSLSARGGGSTIAQQLVKNTLLKNERTFLRKFVEMVLALELEKRISKSRILSAYLCKIYWGHGIYGVKSASKFYFGKHPSFLTLGECALLVGMIPAPELRSPFRDYCRGKIFQARVLKRMVNGGFLDVDAALSAMMKLDSLKSAGLLVAEQSLLPSTKTRIILIERSHSYSSYSLYNEGGKDADKSGERESLATVKEWWEWERDSCVWEVREEMVKWALSYRTKEGFKKTNQLLPSKKPLLSLLLHPISLLYTYID